MSNQHILLLCAMSNIILQIKNPKQFAVKITAFIREYRILYAQL